MKRPLAVVAFVGLLSAWAGAQGTVAPTPSQQAQFLDRNRDLYRAAVDGSLTLTSQIDPLERAASSTKLAKQWAAAIEIAAKSHDASRVDELGQHLGLVVDRGVVLNLQQARKNIKAGSESERVLFQRRDEAVELLKPLENSLRSSRDFALLADTLSQRRGQVEQAAK